ncbi:GH116 family glycosyl-hydrolase [Hamadaea tsunoensis]|uniref:GH116 family glycosyl-hydrolase n=1 Tax=Hamadaea tsunoensis TaxID=53368 RepID=UPI0003FFD67F|nr:GH116 family glycosyl-hydrolase [Hamadaea tsunoensis]
MRELGPEATVAAFPLGGIGTGNVSIGARGELRDWELANRPDKGAHLPFSFFAIRAARAGAPPVTKVLESRLAGPHDGDQGHYAGSLAGLPRLDSSRMRGEYPLLRIGFEDAELGVGVELTAFTPFVPLDADASGIPGAVLRYEVTNPGPDPVDVTVAGSLANPVGIVDRDVFHFPKYAGQPDNTWVDEPGLRGIRFGTDLAGTDFRYGTAVLATTDDSTTAKPQWLSGFWQDGVQVFWDDLRADGRLDPETAFSLDQPPYPDWFTRLRVGSLAVAHRLAPGATQAFEFLLTWHFPNRRRAWQGNINLDNTNKDLVVRNHYATAYEDAWAVARQLRVRLPELERATRTFHSALFGSSLPPEVIDAATANLVVLRSTTCFRLEGGRFAAWEGSFEHAGSCEGTCTHVWNYAQAAAFLFPELERDARRTEFVHETRPDGRMNFRANSVFGNEPWDFHPAVDGQLGAIVRLYREWRFSGDDDLLRECWPGVRRAIAYAFGEWDADGDGVLDSRQHNTYDIEFHGPNSLANSMFFAALTAVARMAAYLGDDDEAARCRDAAALGAERMDALLFNGEYYEQRIDDVDERRYQYGSGCLSDQVFGQLLAHLAGLGHVLPPDHVRSAIAAVYAHNFRPDLSGHHSVQRTYALNGEAGLVLCSWPRGGRPRIPFVYSDEVWTGIEYQVATHLVIEGLVEEGLHLVRSVRDRHDGVRRNPWNEVECGNHYARSLASWGLVVALAGADYDARTRTLTLRPRWGGDDARLPFTTATGWGELRLTPVSAELELLGGDLDLTAVAVHHPRLGPLGAGPVLLRPYEIHQLAPINPLSEED